MIKIHMVNKIKYTGFTEYEGLTTVNTKKEFLNLVGKMYDSVKENNNLVCNFSIMNTNPKE